jgi:broad specificity phosphatase PhoE
MRIYLLRHGTTDWNNAGIVPGMLPEIHLNQEGVERSERVATRLSQVPFRRILSSPLERAIQTAKIINRSHNLEIETDKRLVDWDLGPWSALTKQQISSQYADASRIWVERPEDLALEGQERLATVANRMVSVVQDLVDQRDTECVLLVSHLDPLAALMCWFVGAPLNSIYSFPLQPACFAEWLYEGHRFKLHHFASPTSLDSIDRW